MVTTVVLIHGAWLTPRAWDRFKARYEARGLAVSAPAWPFLARPLEQLRGAPAPGLAKLSIARIVDHYASAIAALDEPPILIGHSFGGLVVQLLLDRGLGACGVAIDPTPPFGVRADPLAVWTSRKVFGAWNGWNRILTMSFEDFASGFAQTLPEADKAAAYAAHIVPGPGRIFFQAVLGIGARVNYDNPARAPLLLISGEQDRTVPSEIVRANAKRQQRSGSRTDLQLFEGRSHWLCNEPGWEDVADFALDWALANAVVTADSDASLAGSEARRDAVKPRTG